MRYFFLIALFFALISALRADADLDADHSNSTVIVYNKKVPESKEIALHYAAARNIPEEQIVALKCPASETITRETYELDIAAPLRAIFQDRDWWSATNSGDSINVINTKIHVVVLIYGMPLRISHKHPPQEIDPETGELKPKPKVPHGSSNGAAIDSELALLGNEPTSLKGMATNPYYRYNDSIKKAGLPNLLLVGRIDGHTPEVAKRLIDDAVAVEKTGLWGRAYIDLAQKGAGYAIGDKWLKTTEKAYEKAGIPAVVDIYKTRYPLNFPMTDAALYFGWYGRHADGPLKDPAFRFLQGAVACHIHSFSATTLRNPKNGWVAPLLNKGAAAVTGNVYEPYLTGTPFLDILNERLLEGHTFIESCYMATPKLSWMTTFVGDPLYRPFKFQQSYQSDTLDDDDFKTWFLLKKKNPYDNAARWKAAHKLALDRKSGILMEALGHDYIFAENLELAEQTLAEAEKLYPLKSPDHLRVRLARIDLLRRAEGGKPRAIAALKKTIVDFQPLPQIKAAEVWLVQLEPPLPPPPDKLTQPTAGKVPTPASDKPAIPK